MKKIKFTTVELFYIETWTTELIKGIGFKISMSDTFSDQIEKYMFSIDNGLTYSLVRSEEIFINESEAGKRLVLEKEKYFKFLTEDIAKKQKILTEKFAD